MRHTFTLLVFCFSLSAFAQIGRGDHVITLGHPTASLTGTANDLGGIFYHPDANYGQLSLRPTYGYALTDRWVVGGSLGLTFSRFPAMLGDDPSTNWNVSLDPYLRYYAINRERLGLYGQVGTGVGINRDGVYGLEALQLQAGLQFPLAAGIRVGPTVDYTIRNRRNYLSVGAGIEVVLGPRSGEDKPTAAFTAGSIMLGSQLLEIGSSRNSRSGALRLGGHYFLTDRIAAGLSLGAGGSRFNFGTAAIDRSYRANEYLATLSGRYYFTTDRRLVWYGEAGAGVSHLAYRSDPVQGDLPEDQTVYSAFGGVGLQWFVRKNIALETGVQFNRNAVGDNWQTTVSTPVGVRFFLR